VSAHPVTDLAALDSNGKGIRVRFLWKDGRYGHQIEVVDGLLTRTLLESVEGDGLTAWPPSPPFQHANVSRIVSDSQHDHVAMLVGATGKSHWSMCVSERDCDELFFDVACRTEHPPEFLGNTYRALFRNVAVSERMNCAFVPADAPGIVVVAQDAEMSLDSNRSPTPIVRCKATETRFDKSPATIRWQYVIRRSSGGPLKITAKTTKQR
jgi:hypothetical protein